MTNWDRLYDVILDAQEDMTHYLGVIDSDHAYIHKAIAFTSFINTGSISAAYKIGFTTPDTKYIHWRPIGITSSANYVLISMTEADSFTEGSAVTPVNRNRVSSTTASTMQAFAQGVTSTPDGVIVGLSAVGSGGNPTSTAGGSSGADEELILKRDTSYVITLTPAGATVCTLALFWYEESSG